MRTIYRDVVGAFIFSSDDKILLGKSNRATYEGSWIVPGGGIDEGETKEQALKREVLEETGIDLDKENAKIEFMDLKLTGESEKILKETGERVLGKYKFYNFNVWLNKASTDIHIESGDDFESITWHSLDTLHQLQLPPPTISTLRHLGLI